MDDRWCCGDYWVCLSSSQRRADLPYSAVYWVHVCFRVRRQTQSFIKGSTLKGQLNYSLLTGRRRRKRRGAAEEMVGMEMLLLSNAPRAPLPALTPSLRDESPSLFPKLINKIRSSTETSTLVGVTANYGTVCVVLWIVVGQPNRFLSF